MKFMVLGADGMVGSGVVRALRERHDVVGITRIYSDVGKPLSFTRLFSFDPAFGVEAPDVVVNCIGNVPQRTNDAEQMIACNALFPHQLRRLWPGKLIHISTDCVFDETVYGRSKMLGEVGMTLRACVVGFSPKRKVSLLDWFVFDSPRAVDGWENAFFSPLTNLELGRAIEKAAENYTEGIFHVSGERMSKCAYLEIVNQEFGLGKTIRRLSEPRIDKGSLCGAFESLTGWRARPAIEQIRELRAELREEVAA